MENSQKIETYFNKELSPAEEQQLLDDLGSDADLKQEFEFQQDIIEGIKDYRKSELIARLNEVKIISTTQQLAVKVISSVAVITVVGLSAYFFYSTNNDTTKLKSDDTVVQTEESQKMGNQVIAEQPGDEEQPEATQDRTIQAEDTPEVKQPEPVAQEDNVTELTPGVTMPDVVETFDSDIADTNTEEDLSIPVNTTSAGINLRTELDVEIKMKRKYNFHYQLIEKKLVLYGDFEDEPFEILEINKEDGDVDLFLYHKEHFYGIVKGSDKIQPFKEISDPQLIGRLESLR